MTNSGILLVDKPVGLSSHSAVGRVRRALATRKVGHAGTLDPPASGLLVIGVGAGTRLLQFLVGLDKTYEATIRLGVATDTEDAQGSVISAPGWTDQSAVAAASTDFVGDILQRPSSVSAIKVAGRRAYARVRAGEEVELPLRPVTVHTFAIHSTRPAVVPVDSIGQVPVVDVVATVRVSSGTYIRALARDLGEALGTVGHLSALRRTRVGPFSVGSAVDPDAAVASDLRGLGAVASQVIPSLTILPEMVSAVSNGRRIPTDHLGSAPVALLSPDGALLAVATEEGGLWRYQMVVPD